MKDFKKMPKMACGGGVGKYEEGGEVLTKTQEASRQRVQEKNARLAQEGKLGELEANSRWVEKNYPEFSKAIKAKPTSGGSGSGGAADMKQLVNPRAMKSGGKVKRGNKKK